MKVAALQLQLRRDDPEGTLDSALRLLRSAKSDGAELACLPELWLPEEFALKRKRLLRELRYAARENRQYVLTGALPAKTDGRVEIVSHLISPQGVILGSQTKVHLFRSQRGKYEAARSLKPVETPLGVIGILVCYDNVFPEAARRLAVDGAELLLIPSRIVKEGVEPWHLYLKVRALENRIPVVAPNVVAPPFFDGHSLIVTLEYDATSDIVYPEAVEASSHEQVLTAEVDLKLCRKLRRSRLRERRPDLY